MTQDSPSPRRLKDDPDFRWETGCDLRDESTVTRDYDLAVGKRRLLAAIAALPPASTAPRAPAPAPAVGSAWLGKPLLGLAVGLAAVGTAFWLGTVVGTTEAPRSGAEAPAPAEAHAPPPPVDPVRTPRADAPPAPLPPPPAAATARSATSAPRPAEPAATTAEPPLPAAEPPATAADPVLEPPPPPAAPAAPSALQADLDAFVRADTLFKDGDFAAARAAYVTYLNEHPSGAMEPEASFGLLLSLHELGDTDGTEEQARLLQDRSGFSTRRPEILRLRAESLVLLDRCEEALPLADALSSRDAAEVRRACRVMRKEGP